MHPRRTRSSHPLRRPSLAVVLLAVALLTLAGCGGDDSPPSTPPNAATSATFEALNVMSSALQSAAGAPSVSGPASIGDPIPMWNQAHSIVTDLQPFQGGLSAPLTVIPLSGTYGCDSSGTVDLTGSVDVNDTFSGGSYGTFTISTAGVTATYNLCSDGFYSVDGGPVTLSVNDSISVSNAGGGLDRYVVSFAESLSGSNVTITNLFTAQSFLITFSAAVSVNMDFTYNSSNGQIVISTFSLSYQVSVNGQTCTITATQQGQTASCSG